MQTPVFKEDHISQIPALQLLIKLGYKYLSPEEALIERNSRTSNVVLEQILENQLRKLNSIEFKGNTYPFSNNNISNAIQSLKTILFDGLIRTNEKIYDLISLGKSFEENIQGSIKSFTLKYIDWDNPENNVYHVTSEFDVEIASGKKCRRPDIVLFINGIPFVVIECKSPHIDNSIDEAISQMIRNQRNDEISNLFIYSQILLAINKNECRYGTTGTDSKFWAVWKEKDDKVEFEKQVSEIINSELNSEEMNKLFLTRYKYVKSYFDDLQIEGRIITEQDKSIFALLRKDRLLELSRQFIVFDNGEKKIARYQQYFAVKKTLSRVKEYDEKDVRRGGVIWHTQGSGKSLTMVMLAKALALDKEIINPRIVLVTDRIDLDDQIYHTFESCDMLPEQAKTGEHLINLLEKDKRAIITTVIDKFDTAINKRSYQNNSKNIFVLVDESHRSQYGRSQAMMRRILPNSVYIGFTGTPLLKTDKNTAVKFGGFIDKYTINQAVEDKAVVPLLYEGRLVEQVVTQEPIDKWFDRVSESLTEYQANDLKRKYSRAEKVNSTEKRLEMIAWDISKHYSKNWKGTGFKAQLAAPRKEDAIKFQKYFDQIGLIKSEVIISSPDTREGNDSVEEEPNSEVQKFWKKMITKYGNEKNYNKQIISAFKGTDDPDLIIVVDKLLTGFDAPRNTILYLAKSLKEHALLQAIARVNRIFEGKDFGYIIDYNGILGELDKALTTYQVLEEFDENDIENTITNINEIIKQLPQKHSELWDVFKNIKSKKDEEEYEQYLSDPDIRQIYYEKLSSFSRILAIAFGSTKFYEQVSEELIDKYKSDLLFFQKLRYSIRVRYAEIVDFKEYESRIQKLLDEYVVADDIVRITEQVNIFDKELFEKEVEKVNGNTAKADMIAHQMIKTIREKYEEDPAFYAKFSKLIQDTIDEYRQHRIDEAEYLKKILTHKNEFIERKDEDLPSIIRNREVAKAFYGITYETIKTNFENEEALKAISSDIGVMIDDIVNKNKVVDWYLKEDIQNKILNEIEDYLYSLKDNKTLELTFEEIDKIMDKSIYIAKKRYS
ncbi:MAG: HsdR family type I site-specific deoxyribonuclease [Candidatus Kapabacteria bacterium]|nr:HsdR family type I site-specific deoxyribonuclease [Candidatus Kapabacteria bacterium]